jgi:hypothetical protein
MCVCIHIHICMSVYYIKYICSYIYIQKHVYTHMNTHIYIYIYIHMPGPLNESNPDPSLNEAGSQELFENSVALCVSLSTSKEGGVILLENGFLTRVCSLKFFRFVFLICGILFTSHHRKSYFFRFVS